VVSSPLFGPALLYVLAGCRKSASCALGERLHTERAEQLVRRVELLARVRPPVFPSQPFAVQQVSARAQTPRCLSLSQRPSATSTSELSGVIGAHWRRRGSRRRTRHSRRLKSRTALRCVFVLLQAEPQLVDDPPKNRTERDAIVAHVLHERDNAPVAEPRQPLLPRPPPTSSAIIRRRGLRHALVTVGVRCEHVLSAQETP
jgi:hypothetical protein